MKCRLCVWMDIIWKICWTKRSELTGCSYFGVTASLPVTLLAQGELLDIVNLFCRHSDFA